VPENNSPKIPPHNIEAEQSVLGAMLLDISAAERAIEMLIPENFYRNQHQVIFDVLQSLLLKNQPIDLITVSEELKKRNKMEEIGGEEYLVGLAEIVPTAANIEYYAKIVEEKSILRKLISTGTNIASMSYRSDNNAEEIAEEAERMIFSISEKRISDSMKDLKTLVMEHYKWLDNRAINSSEVSGVGTGFWDLDSITTGLQPSDFIIIAARPSMGKTALALDIAINASIVEKKTVAIFSLEMSAEQLVQRMISSRSMLNMQSLRKGRLQSSDWEKISKSANDFYDANIFIDDSTEISPINMRAKCRRLKAQHGLDLIVVDYLQLMKSSSKTENRTQEISEIARGLKSLARETKCPVIALSQLSRAVEQRTDKRPMLSDLRESGSIEAEADLVLMLYRPSYYEKKELMSNSSNTGEIRNSGQQDGDCEEAEIIISKHRNGPTGIINLGFRSQFASFCNLEHRYDED